MELTALQNPMSKAVLTRTDTGSAQTIEFSDLLREDGWLVFVIDRNKETMIRDSDEVIIEIVQTSSNKFKEGTIDKSTLPVIKRDKYLTW